MREKITLNTTTSDLLTLMSESNPGALSVLNELIKKPDGIVLILHLDDMNIRGCQIWVGYKDYSKEDIGIFVENIQNRNQQMIDVINNECLYDGFKEKAVILRASYYK